MKKQFSGMMAAIPTPFGKNEEILEDSFRRICERIIASGMQNILVCGSTGEYSELSFDERKKAMKMVVDIVDHRCKVVASCAGHNQAETLDMVAYAEKIGIDYALVVPPYYLTTTEEGIYQYYKTIGESLHSGTKLLVYNYPEVTTVRLSPEFVEKLSHLPNVAGIKDTDTLIHTSKTCALTRDSDFGVVNGYEHLALGSLVSGASGTVGLIDAVCPEQMMTIWNAVQNNDIKTAMEMNDRLKKLYDLMETENVPAAIKAAFNLMGIECGNPRLPLLPASEKLKDELRTELKKFNLI